MTFSIIVPVYNVERYLNHCLDSIITQNLSLSEYEIILVDDGSTDKSGKICDEYTVKYENILTIHQQNQGLSGARNTGIRASHGNYLVFLDSDDFVHENSFLHLKKCLMDKPDVIVCNSMKFDDASKELKKYNYLLNRNCMIYDVLNEYEKLIANKEFTITAWSFVVKREFLIDNHLFFEPGILHEDDLWSHYIMMSASSMRYNSHYLCCYRMNRKTSIMQAVSYKHIESYLIIIDRLNSQKEGEGITEVERRIILRKMASIYITLCYNAADYIKTENKDMICKYIKSFSYLLIFENYKFSRVLIFLQKVLGVYVTELIIYKSMLTT